MFSFYRRLTVIAWMRQTGEYGGGGGVNVYAQNQGPEWVTLFKLSKNKCCTDVTLDRTGQELHPQSCFLGQTVKEADLVDAWRRKHPSTRQYTWIKITDHRVSAARLDRFYISTPFSTCVTNCQIHPVGFTDHHLVLVVLLLSPARKAGNFWHFNVKLLNDSNFCGNFKLFWANWGSKKELFPSLSQWWAVGKGQIRVFSQQYTSYSTENIKRAMEQLEADIKGTGECIY